MKRLLAISLCMCSMSSLVSAELVRGIDIEFVSIDNPGNPGDIRPEARPNGCGAVDYTYNIGKYEITNGQWDAFVTASGAPTGNDGGYSDDTSWTGTNVATTEISWYEAAQFCNYLTSGDKSKGAYQFSGNNVNPVNFLGIDRAASISIYGTTYVLPTEDEWYKAAYFTGSGYSTFANGTNSAPVLGTDANYGGVLGINQPWEVGNGLQEQNGTFDMMGNVVEWNEVEFVTNGRRGARGGSYADGDFGDYPLRSTATGAGLPYWEFSDLGFRVASIPEPCTLLLLGMGGLLMRKRK